MAMKSLTPEELARYRQTLNQREREGQQRLAQRFEAAIHVTQTATELLKQEFQATQVILFGSLVHRERFHLSSDIDLAVRGLAPLDYFTAVAKLQDLSTFKIDLVRLERCKPSLQVVIKAEGQEL
jgi:uncharacterized protein